MTPCVYLLQRYLWPSPLALVKSWRCLSIMIFAVQIITVRRWLSHGLANLDKTQHWSCFWAWYPPHTQYKTSLCSYRSLFDLIFSWKGCSSNGSVCHSPNYARGTRAWMMSDIILACFRLRHGTRWQMERLASGREPRDLDEKPLLFQRTSRLSLKVQQQMLMFFENKSGIRMTLPIPAWRMQHISVVQERMLVTLEASGKEKKTKQATYLA